MNIHEGNIEHLSQSNNDPIDLMKLRAEQIQSRIDSLNQAICDCEADLSSMTKELLYCKAIQQKFQDAIEQLECDHKRK